MSLAALLLTVQLASGAAGAPPVYDPETHTCDGYVERTAPEIIARHKLGERNFDCTKLPKVVGDNHPFRDFSRADLSNATFRGSKLPRTLWVQTYLVGTDFEGANLSYSTMRPSDDTIDSFNPMDLSHTRMRCSMLTGPFVGADFSDADLRCAGDNFTSLWEADLSYTDLTGARFDPDTYFPYSEYLQCVVMPKRELRRLNSARDNNQQRRVIIGQMDCPESSQQASYQTE